MRTDWIGVTILGVAAAITSCKDERVVSEETAAEEIAGAVCSASFACDCSMRPFDSEADCEAAKRSEQEALFEAAKQAGLTYDGSCVGRYLDAYEGLGCDPLTFEDDDVDGSDCGSYCAPYHGDVPVGGDCTMIEGSGLSDCAQGLFCDGTCVDFCQGFGLGEGEVCAADGMQEPCAEGLYCQVDTQGMGTCVKEPGEGEPCPNGNCAEGLFCPFSDTEPVCTKPRDVGAACQFGTECVTEYCDAGACAQPPAEGQPCTGTCADDLYCIEGTCSQGPGEGQPCYEGYGCAAGLTCADSETCEQPEPLACYILGF